jgi:hypothetical protein
MLHDHDLGDGLNEILPKAVSIRALGGNHEHVADTYVFAKIVIQDIFPKLYALLAPLSPLMSHPVATRAGLQYIVVRLSVFELLIY